MGKQLISIFFIFSLLYQGILFAEKSAPEVRQITPPKLDSLHLGKRILCHRPMREGTPRMSIGHEGGKLIAHNYGFGGSGWTLGPGAAQYVVNLLSDEMKKMSLTQSEPIAVVGAGVLGLFSALDLVTKGFKNVTIYAEAFENLTSHNAGGLLAPVSMSNVPKVQPLIDRIGVEAYRFYKSVIEGKHIFLKDGVRLVPTYFENRKDSGLEPYVTAGVMKPAKNVILDFGNGTKRSMVAYDDGIFMNTANLMQDLHNILKGKVKFIKRKITSLNEITQNVIINCTGKGAGQLVNDSKMVSVQGHLIMLKDQNPKDIDYMLLVYFDKAKTKAGFNVERSFYIFPKQLLGSKPVDIGVIGGTFIEGAGASTPNEEEFGIMVQGAKDFYGIK
ncbi:MAG: FAD-binding oxidoreductase [Alphaproteobacteria bacterium]|nr:FAD-binding oxidoreductase [Alphaproteobacteria bacterium]